MRSLSPERYGNNYKCLILHILEIDISLISCKINLRWTIQDFTEDNPTLAYVTAWVLPVNKPSLEPISTQIYLTLWIDYDINANLFMDFKWTGAIWFNNLQYHPQYICMQITCIKLHNLPRHSNKILLF